VALKEFAEKNGGVFTKVAIVGAKSGEEVGVDVELASDFAVDKDGDDDFGFGFEGAGEVTGIGADVVDHDGFAGGGSGATNALIERNARVRGHSALKRTENEDVAVWLFFQQVKTNPVVASEFFVEKGDDAFHEGIGGGRGARQSVEIGDEVGSFALRGGHGE